MVFAALNLSQYSIHVIAFFTCFWALKWEPFHMFCTKLPPVLVLEQKVDSQKTGHHPGKLLQELQQRALVEDKEALMVAEYKFR